MAGEERGEFPGRRQKAVGIGQKVVGRGQAGLLQSGHWLPGRGAVGDGTRQASF